MRVIAARRGAPGVRAASSFLVAAWIAAAAAVAAAAGAGPPEPASVVRRTTLIVHDIDASIRFYRDVMGFEVWLENRGTVSEGSLPSDAPRGAPSRFAIMKGRHPWVGMIGLLQYGEARPPPAPPTRLRPGDSVLMIETTELAQIHERMLRSGTPIYRAPQTSEVTGAGGARWTATFLFAFDPDGHMLEVNERRPLVAAAAAAITGAPPGVTRGAEAPSATPKVSVRREFLDGRYGQLHLRRAMPAQPGALHATVVLLHQSPLSSRMFSEFLPQLARDRLVLAPDTPGYGESDGPPAPVPLGDYAAALHAVIERAGEPVDLVGYHTGALLAAEIAARWPQDVRRLVLISIPVFAPQRRAALRTETAIAEDGSALLAEWRSTMGVRPPGQSLEQAARIVAEKQRAGSRAGWAMAAMRDYDPLPRLPLIRASTTIVRPKDSLWDDGANAAKLIPGARLIDAPQWGYGLFDAAPAEVAAIVRTALD